MSVKQEMIEKEKEEKKICQICESEYLINNHLQLINCLHSFCKTCWLNYITICIIEKKQTQIRCMNDLCNEILSEKFIYNLIKDNKNLIVKHKENKLREEILNNPNKKFCPYPNCDSYAKRKDKNEQYVKCENNHLFCFNCLNKPHEGKNCEIKLDENMEEFSKKRFIKKCPNCGIWTEKNEGCNHITCIECNHQWCWLCNQKYTSDHYIYGKCRGFQFVKPKNENEIQLLFEGKIKLRKDERMYKINNNNIERIAFIEKIFLIFLFLLLGFIIINICQSGKYSNNTNLLGKKKSFFILIYSIFVIIISFLFFFLQVFLNIILLIFIVFRENEFFYDFKSQLNRIKNLEFENRNRNFINYIYFLISYIIGCFFNLSFLIIGFFISTETFEFSLNNNSSEYIFSVLFTSTIFLINFSMLIISIYINIPLMILLLCKDGVTSIFDGIAFISKIWYKLLD